MRKKTDEIEDKAVKPPSPLQPIPEAEGNEGGVAIRMRSGRAWVLPDRTLQPGERVVLDEATAQQVVEAGYADFVDNAG